MMQRYFAGELRPDQLESWRAPDGIFYLVSEVDAAMKEREAEWVGIATEEMNKNGKLRAENARQAEEIAALKASFNIERKRRCQCEFEGSICYSECKYHGKISSDALTMALRLYGEDPNTFSPECQKVMEKWRNIVETALGKDSNFLPEGTEEPRTIDGHVVWVRKEAV